MPNPPPKEDSWALQPIGAPFAANPVKIIGQMNMYVARWHDKDGKPIHGLAWNDGGVVQASIPAGDNTELLGKQDLGGVIHVLQYKGDHNTLGFWYEWILYKDRFEKGEDERQLVKCGDSMPIVRVGKPGHGWPGSLDTKTGEAVLAKKGEMHKITGAELDGMKILVRNLKGGPPGCVCDSCPKTPPAVLEMDTVWADIRMGDPWPEYATVKAGIAPDETADQSVALWFLDGHPVFGRAWNDNGKVAAAFSWEGKTYVEGVGSFQVLVNPPDHVRGYDYHWRPVDEIMSGSKSGKQYLPMVFQIRTKTGTGTWHEQGEPIMGSGLIKCACGGGEVIGRLQMRHSHKDAMNAAAVIDGKEVKMGWPVVRRSVDQFLMLCRKAKPGHSNGELE